MEPKRNQIVVGIFAGAILVIFLFFLWKSTLGAGPSQPTAKVPAGSTPVYRASGEPLPSAGHTAPK